MGKYFLVNPKAGTTDKGLLGELMMGKAMTKLKAEDKKDEEELSQLSQKDNLKHIQGRVVLKIDMDGKDYHVFESGLRIERKRRFDNLNQREVSPVNAIVISGENIKEGAEILIHPNAVHDSNRIFDYKDSNDNIRYYSIHNEMCFAWHDGEDWQPIYPYEFALRVFKPYEGLIAGIEPTQLKDTLFVTSGMLQGKVCKTLKACDYEIVFQDKNGREGNLIRFRPFGHPEKKMEEEAIAELHDVTEKVLSGKFLVGISLSDAKPLKENVPLH
jgi:hypothetical protein